MRILARAGEGWPIAVACVAGRAARALCPLERPLRISSPEYLVLQGVPSASAVSGSQPSSGVVSQASRLQAKPALDGLPHLVQQHGRRVPGAHELQV